MDESRYCKKCEVVTTHEKFELGKRKIQEFQSIRLEFHSVVDDATFWVACTRCRIERNRVHLPTISEAGPEAVENPVVK